VNRTIKNPFGDRTFNLLDSNVVWALNEIEDLRHAILDWYDNPSPENCAVLKHIAENLDVEQVIN